MEIELTCEVILGNPPIELSRAMQRKLTIPNPEFVEAEKMGLPKVGIPKTIKLYEKIEEGLIFPKGAIDMLFEECLKYPKKKIIFKDSRLTPNPVNFTFQGKLGILQKKAADLILKHDSGVWEPPTWINKEIVVLYLIAQKKQPALIVVDSTELFDKWVDLVEKYLGIKKDDVGGTIGDKIFMGDKINVFTVHSLHKRGDRLGYEMSPHIGHLILDGSTTRETGRKYLDIVEQFHCKCQLWMTSSSRRIFLNEMIRCYVGPSIGQIDKKDLFYNRDLHQGEAFFIPTGYTPFTDPSVDYSGALTEMTQDLDRNQLIAKTILKYRGNGITLILSERQQHCEAIGNILKNQDSKSVVAIITGETPAKQIQQIMKDLKPGWGSRFLLVTNQTIGNFFDLPEIETLVMATPFNFSKSFMKTIRLALRPGYKKDRTVILDFADDHEVFEEAAQICGAIYFVLGLSVLSRIEEKEEWCADSPFDEIDSSFDDDIDSLFGS